MRFEGCSDFPVRYTTRVMRKYINVSICKSKCVAGGLSIATGFQIWRALLIVSREEILAKKDGRA